MWGGPSAEDGRLQVVNGYYQLTRGSFAQFGLPVPYPERVVDAVLDHGTGAGGDGYRAAEIRSWAERQVALALPRWREGRGFGFGPGTAGPGPEPGLQGTEMWLAIIWYLADLLGRSDELAYRPRGVHRPEPARTGLSPEPAGTGLSPEPAHTCPHTGS
ncbi:hypothetical protein ACQEWB_45445 [Streptomyces sp. CA-249302]|uniref:hypothetical protein n=1 Tax=Streptomyces sp. CA-249302 TaxID=3240058 RepID=UPI003D8E4632